MSKSTMTVRSTEGLVRQSVVFAKGRDTAADDEDNTDEIALSNMRNLANQLVARAINFESGHSDYDLISDYNNLAKAFLGRLPNIRHFPELKYGIASKDFLRYCKVLNIVIKEFVIEPTNENKSVNAIIAGAKKSKMHEIGKKIRRGERISAEESTEYFSYLREESTEYFSNLRKTIPVPVDALREQIIDLIKRVGDDILDADDTCFGWSIDEFNSLRQAVLKSRPDVAQYMPISFSDDALIGTNEFLRYCDEMKACLEFKQAGENKMPEKMVRAKVYSNEEAIAYFSKLRDDAVEAGNYHKAVDAQSTVNFLAGSVSKADVKDFLAGASDGVIGARQKPIRLADNYMGPAPIPVVKNRYLFESEAVCPNEANAVVLLDHQVVPYAEHVDRNGNVVTIHTVTPDNFSELTEYPYQRVRVAPCYE